jgi:catechol 2,3-dioxygenase-like lactoylglutathione lyase family enzyme
MFFDHMVIFEKASLQDQVTKLKESGLHAGIGGKHENWGTENALLYFGLSYVEWLRMMDPEKAAMSENPLVQKLVASPQGPGHFAIRTHDMDSLRSRFHLAGLQTIHLPGERRRSDGKLLQWELLFVEDQNDFWPFFIQWEESEAERLTDLERGGWTGWETASDLKVDHIEIAVKDAAHTAEVWSDLLSLQLLESDDHSVLVELEGGNVRLITMPDAVSGPRKLLLSNGHVMK